MSHSPANGISNDRFSKETELKTDSSAQPLGSPGRKTLSSWLGLLSGCAGDYKTGGLYFRNASFLIIASFFQEQFCPLGLPCIDLAKSCLQCLEMISP